MKDLQKQIASQKRKMEADKFSDKCDLLTSISTVNVCRDERIVERKGILYKDTINGNISPNPRRSYK